MGSNEMNSRIDTLELKSLILKKFGHQRADKYFDQLTKLFSLKITKCEFDKFFLRIIGRENISLHNHFIRSILKNTCLGKVPPHKGVKRAGSNLTDKTENGYKRNCLQSLYRDAFPSSPRKGRSPVSRDRKCRDRPSPLGPLGKPQSMACEELNSRAQEQQSATELLSLGSRPPIEFASEEDGEEVDQMAVSPGVQSRSPVTAPFGVLMNPGGSRKALTNISRSNYIPETCPNSGELPDTISLRSCLEQKLEMEGVSVSLDCVNLLNNGLDAYLKRLIEPCMALAGSRSDNEQLKSASGEFIPGLNGTTLPGRYAQRQRKSVNASMLDFRVAMESNPQILGEDWPVQLEKISMHGFEER
ncbi:TRANSCRIPTIONAL REGULATOR OF RNA POLII SAGA SUBUNIT [Salix koriyanagi]|uniref:TRANSCRIPTIONAL REGULATOR OF RNA POLII SAGA SUBUNIT n=1 Tax=Salix koriyanagi TaxID=2511006 RepID=A0A9Q0X3N8_9ROSI|nr:TRANSCRIPTIONAL REGULATOR OF RNA POLII SAGA SUBUNIT [Salix koriyanagi]